MDTSRSASYIRRVRAALGLGYVVGHHLEVNAGRMQRGYVIVRVGELHMTQLMHYALHHRLGRLPRQIRRHEPAQLKPLVHVRPPAVMQLQEFHVFKLYCPRSHHSFGC